MTTEEINKLNENPSGDKVMDFINAIEKDGYTIANYSTVRELTEIIARGGLDPIKNYNSLKELESRISNIDGLTDKFRFGVRDALDKILNIVSKDSKFVDNEKQLETMVNKIKAKLGVIQAVNRVAEAEASRAKTKAAIDALDSNTSLSPEQKNQEFKRLLFTYNGANVRAIENAKKIATMQENNFSSNLGMEFIEELGNDLKELHNYLLMMNLLPETKKTLIDEFTSVIAIRNEYKGSLAKHNSNLKLYENTMGALGLSKNSKKSNTKKTEPTEKKDPVEKPTEPELPIHRMSDILIYKGRSNGVGAFAGPALTNFVPGEECKVVDQKIIDGIVHYKLEGKGEEYYSSLEFEPKEISKKADSETIQPFVSEPNQEPVPNPAKPEGEQELGEQTPEKPKKGKLVTEQTPAESIIRNRIGKGAIAVRFAAVAYVTGAVLVPIAGPVALIPALVYAYKEYQDYAKTKRFNNELTIMQRVFPFLRKKLEVKMGQPETSPEEVNDIKGMVDEINESITSSQEAPKVEEEVSTGDPVLDENIRRAQEMMEQEGLTREEAVEQTINQQANQPSSEPEVTKGM